MAHQTLHADETDTVEFHEVFSVVEMSLQEFETYEEAVGEAALELGEGARFQVEKTIVVETIVRADQPSTIDNPPPAPAPIPVAVPPVVTAPAAPVEEQPTEPVQAPLTPPDIDGDQLPLADDSDAPTDAPTPDAADDAPSTPDAWQDDPAHNTEPGPIDTSNAIFTPSTTLTPATPSTDTPATPTTSTEPVPDTES